MEVVNGRGGSQRSDPRLHRRVSLIEQRRNLLTVRINVSIQCCYLFMKQLKAVVQGKFWQDTIFIGPQGHFISVTLLLISSSWTVTDHKGRLLLVPPPNSHLEAATFGRLSTLDPSYAYIAKAIVGLGVLLVIIKFSGQSRRWIRTRKYLNEKRMAARSGLNLDRRLSQKSGCRSVQSRLRFKNDETFAGAGFPLGIVPFSHYIFCGFSVWIFIMVVRQRRVG